MTYDGVGDMNEDDSFAAGSSHEFYYAYSSSLPSGSMLNSPRSGMSTGPGR